MAWATWDADKFKALNDVHGHVQGDKAIQHFGKTIRETATALGIPVRAFRQGGDEFAFAVPKERAAEFVTAVEEASAYTKGDVTTKLTGAYGNTFGEADATLISRKARNRATISDGETANAPAGRRSFNVELHTNDDTHMARINELPAQDVAEIRQRLIDEVVSPIAESAGVKGPIGGQGQGGWYTEGLADTQPSIELSFPATTDRTTARAVVARVSETLKQSAFFEVEEQAGGGRIATYIDFGSKLSDTTLRPRWMRSRKSGMAGTDLQRRKPAARRSR